MIYKLLLFIGCGLYVGYWIFDEIQTYRDEIKEEEEIRRLNM